ncbi:MAG: spore coat protein [FCB group bacterium]|nr:spore coat protein [FCB group bacterium]
MTIYIPQYRAEHHSVSYFLMALMILASLLLLNACSGDENENVGTEPEVLDTADWTETTHGNSVDPDYDEVFAENVVKRIDIVITSTNWQAMLDDMTAQYGTFGATGPGGPNSSVDDNPIWVPCSFFYKDIQWYKVGVRFKGNSSLQSAWSSGIHKLSLKLDFDEFEDTYPAIENQRFYGFKQLNLNNGFEDSPLMREKAAAEILREAGVPVAHAAFYRVYVDFGEGPVYFGLYTMVEEVDDSVIDDQFEGDDGNLYKPTGSGASFADGTFSENDFDKKSNEDDADWSDIRALFTALHSEDRTKNPEHWRDSLESIFDVQGFLKWLAVNTVMQNWDSYGKMTQNYYLYNNPSTGQITWIPWDHNEALKEGKMGGALSIALSEVSGEWPLIRYLIDDETYQAVYASHVRSTIDEVFEPSRMTTKYQSWHNLIQPYVTGDEGELTGYTFLQTASDFESDLGFLLDHVSQRNIAAEEYLSSMQ